MIALLDNTVISNFSVVQRPDLVQDALRDEVATRQATMNEYNRGVQLGRLPLCDWRWLPILELTENEAKLQARLATGLGLGESACIVCAYVRGLRVFTDDRDARRAALELHIPISGTLGLLLMLVDADVLPLREADVLLARMVQAGYRAPLQSLAELL